MEFDEPLTYVIALLERQGRVSYGALKRRFRLDDEYRQAVAARGPTRFVGRQLEIETLRQALGQAAAGHGQVVAVIGEPGVGKTRLFYDFTRSHRTQGWLVLESSAVSYGRHFLPPCPRAAQGLLPD